MSAYGVRKVLVSFLVDNEVASKHEALVENMIMIRHSRPPITLKGVEQVTMLVDGCVRFRRTYPRPLPAPPPPPTHPACERRDLPNADAKRDCLVPCRCASISYPPPPSTPSRVRSWSRAQHIRVRLLSTA